MNTFPDFYSRYTFSLSFVLKKLIENSFKLINKFDFFKIFLQLIDTHSCNWNNFLFHGWISGHVLMILTIIHSIKSLEELSQFITNMIKTKDKDLKMWPYFIQSSNKIMRIFCHFINRCESRLNVTLYKMLDILSDEFIHLHLISSCWFLCWQLKDNSK